MGYSENEAMVRVDFFKPSGKWYTTEAVHWTAPWQGRGNSIHECFKSTLRKHFKETPDRLSEMDAVCLHPYHEYSHPIQIKNGGWRE